MTTTTKTFKAPSERQVTFLTDLTAKRDVAPGKNAAEALAALTHWFAQDKRSSSDVSKAIDTALAAPKRLAFAPVVAVSSNPAKPLVPFTPVPDVVPTAKFAVLSELLTELPANWAKQEYTFWEVKKMPKKDARVINRLVGAPGSFQRSRLPYALRAELLARLEDPAFAYQASLTFAEIYQVCGRCAAELTDTDSRERKFGLSCWNQMASYRAAVASA